MLGTTSLYYKREVKLITLGFTLLKKKSLRNGFLPLLLTVTWLTIKWLVISYSFTLKRRPSIQLSVILATTSESHGRRGI
jgi:hypothetical protein